jgi:protocatechuate 3,4-dioxygenase beta subunit
MPRDPPREVTPRSGTAAIRGLVTDQETGQPISRATVTVMSPALRPDASDQQTFTRPLQAVTGSDGRFEFKNLPAGEYTVTAGPGEFRASHLNQMYGIPGPMDMSRPTRPKPLSLRDGEVREDVNVALWRAFAVEGRVVDEFGEPMAGVEVLAKAPESGQRVARAGPWQMTTDDRGMFRVFGIPPGRYLICATPRNFVMPMPSAEVKDRAIQTCYPAAVIDSDAAAVTISNSDVTGIDIRVQRSRAFTASGVALDSSGAPLAQNQISVVRIDRTGGGTSSSGIEVQPGGRFIARGLTPGEYAINAQIGSPFNPLDSTREREIGYVPFRVENADVEGLVVTTAKTAKITGRVVFEDDPPGTPGSIRISTMPDMANRMFMMGPPANAQVKPDLTFELSGLFGPLTVQVGNPPRGWIAKSIRFKGEEIIDTLHDFTNARSSDVMEIVLTSRGARITGRVTNDKGEPAPEAMLLLVPADPARRRGAINPLMFGGAAPKADGSYQIGPVRAGEYMLAAVASEDLPRPAPGGPDPEFYERLSRVAQRVSFAESEQQTLDLRVTKIP